jgi:hypothetical protein
LPSPEGSDSTPTHCLQDTRQVGSDVAPHKARLLHCGVADVDASTGRGCCHSLHASPRNRAAAPRNALPIRLRSFNFGCATNAGVDGRWHWIADRPAKDRKAPRRMTRAHDLRRITPCGGCPARVNDHAPGCTVTRRGPSHATEITAEPALSVFQRVGAQSRFSCSEDASDFPAEYLQPPAALHHRVNVRLMCVTVAAC